VNGVGCKIGAHSLTHFENNTKGPPVAFRANIKKSRMKTMALNQIKDTKNKNPKQAVTHSSVDFQDMKRGLIDKAKSSGTDFFQELKELIRSGDDSVWRMWR
jgi:hypothetical protein